MDLGTNAKRYIRFYPWKDFYNNNPVANLLREDKDVFRVKVLGHAQESQPLNSLVSMILPYHRIPVVDPPAMSRMPNDYNALFKHMESHFVGMQRSLDYFNVKYILTVHPIQDASLDLTPIGSWQGINIYKRNSFLPRAWFAEDAVVTPEGTEKELFETLHPRLDLRQTVVLDEKPALLPLRQPFPLNFGSTVSTTNSVAQIVRDPIEWKVREDNFFELEVVCEKPEMLVLSEKWDADWKAWVDGQPSKIFRANSLMRGVELTPGKHVVRMEYRPSTIPFWISAISLGVFVLWGIGYGIRTLMKARE
jgi:hypothetical protein